jgi:hypothetical protein
MTPPSDDRWSPFPGPPWRDCRAAAEAVLRARELAQCALHELTQEHYADVRGRNPHIGLPRDTTIERACGSWTSALEQAGDLARAALRRKLVTD